ncbi:MAG: tRNA pseudouridine(55) synthase TruB [Gammaproteobacteria bacterium]|nr:MAG: tRNA pseudouridine(55) synthase TruB [Gammaproteobacteria bacterium]
MSRRRRRGRPVDGLLLLDKPAGLTSNAALQRVKSLYRAQKAGHTGNLDPLATGLLPICLGEATKFTAFLLDADKRYLTRARLGLRTTTGDAEGEVIERREVPELDREGIERVLERFRGRIEQVPPMHSAIKRQGRPLYELAREGVTVEREPREVEIHSLELVDLGTEELELEVHCSKGTYIRTLIEDIGEALGCGAHVSALRRTAAGPFGIDDAVTLQRLEELAVRGDLETLDGLLLPVDRLLAGLPAQRLAGDSGYYFAQGQAVQQYPAPAAGLLRMYDEQGRFLGVGESTGDGRIAPRRLVRTGRTG